MPKQLLVIAGPDEGRSFPLIEGKVLNLGRSKAHSEIFLHDLRLERVHCEVEVQGDELVVTDMESTEGTLVDGQRVSKHTLAMGGVFRVGDTEICFQEVGAQKPIKKAPAPTAPAACAPPSRNLEELPGTTLGHYQVGSILGKGHVGVVFKVRDLKNDRQLALKVLHPEFPRNDAEMQQFAQAVKTILPLRQPNLVTVFGAGKTGLYCWLALEYVEGESLAEVIERTGTAGRADWRQCFRIALQLARALQFAHQHQLYHRNLTPQNILLRASDRMAKLNDLILATALKGSQIKQVAMRGKTLSELVYLPPEQTYQNAQVDGRSDLYSVGTILYAVLAGRLPFQGESVPDTIRKIRVEEPAPPEGLHSCLRGLFEETVRRLLAKNPNHRFQSADELVTDLDRVAWEQGIKV